MKRKTALMLATLTAITAFPITSMADSTNSVENFSTVNQGELLCNKKGKPVQLWIQPKNAIGQGDSIILHIENGKFDKNLITQNPFVFATNRTNSSYEKVVNSGYSSYDILKRFVGDENSRQLPYGFKWISEDELEVELFPIDSSKVNRTNDDVTQGTPIYSIALPISTSNSPEGSEVRVTIDSNGTSISGGVPYIVGRINKSEADNNVEVYNNNTTTSPSATYTGTIINNTTMVPIRGVFEGLGFNVDYDNATATAIISNNQYTVKIPKGKTYILVNEKSINPSVPQQVINGSLYLPLRIVAESVNASVDWDSKSKTSTITYGNKAVKVATSNTAPESSNNTSAIAINSTTLKVRSLYYNTVIDNFSNLVNGLKLYDSADKIMNTGMKDYNDTVEEIVSDWQSMAQDLNEIDFGASITKFLLDATKGHMNNMYAIAISQQLAAMRNSTDISDKWRKADERIFSRAEEIKNAQTIDQITRIINEQQVDNEEVDYFLHG